MNSYKFAKFLEEIFFPPLSVSYFIVIMLLYFRSIEQFSVNFLALTILVVSFYSFVKVFYNKIKRKDTLFFLGLIISFLIFSLINYVMPVYKEFYLVTIAILGAGIIAYAIRHYWKISAHMTSLTVSIISLAIINNMFIVFAILIPIVAWCRIKLKAHTYFQVIGGAILGILMPLLVHFVF